ncbi:hypothetical protein [Pseudomonas sp. B11(2017)]|uniref:hypothetical protein n=1 Tax=Pseudomonas sp. B11(2017) TaxID=1981748 RepID=UPI000A1E3DAE|nr:hypothetical protein [Pseudomonas sp. B11(2017)]
MPHKPDAHVVAALMAIGLNERDHRWAQRTCLALYESERESVVASAVQALGQLDALDPEQLLPTLERLKRRFPSWETSAFHRLEAKAMAA